MRHVQLYALVNRRQRRQAATARSLRRRLGRLAFGCAAFALLAVVAATLVVGAAYANLTTDLPSVQQIPGLLDPVNGPLLQPTRLYDRSGQVLLMSLENPGYQRRYLSIDPNQVDTISPEMLRVSIALLEPGFWQSPGFAWRSLLALEPLTVAERLALDLLLWQEPSDLRRAARMRLLAAQLVHTYGRAQVLEWYLNSAYFGHLAYGAESAARLYLGQPASRVNLAGAALLMAVHQAPALNPLDAPEAARERQAQALDQLLARGLITAEEHQRARAEGLQFAPVTPENALPGEAFTRLAIDQLAARFGRQRVERGGLRVITTLDYNLQLELTCLAQTQLRRLNSPSGSQADEAPRLPGGSPCQAARLLPSLSADQRLDAAADLAASAVILDPLSGEVLALLGDTTSVGEGPWLTARPPGSLLTPVAAVAAFARGFGPASLVWDIPASLPQALSAYQRPQDDYRGPLRLRQALANDTLTPIAQLLEQLGAQNVWRLSSALGLASLANQTSPALIYDQGQVSPLEIAQMYAIFANQGVRSGQRQSGEVKPALAIYVEDVISGEVLLDARQPESLVVLSAPLAYMIHHVLSDSIARRPSLGYPNLLEIGRPSAAKLGQVNPASDADAGSQVWAAGYTRQRVAVFWLGAAQAEHETLNPRAAAGMWHAAMQYMQRDLPVEDWPEPAGLTHLEVCDPSGQLPTSDCPNVVSELFLLGNEPTVPDSLYRAVQINRETGRLATVFTPPASIEEHTYLVAPPEARAWVLAAGLPLPPEEYDAIQPPVPSPNVNITNPGLYAYVRGVVALQGTAGGDGFGFYQLQAGQGLNPSDWLQAAPDGKQPVQAGLLGKWDTSGLDGLYAIRLMVVRQDQSVETSIVQVTVDNRAPLARLIYPVAGQSFDDASEQIITFRASVSDTVGVARMVWLVDGRVVGENLQAPYTFTWAATRGEHSVQVKAFDLAGNEGLSETTPFFIP